MSGTWRTDLSGRLPCALIREPSPRSSAALSAAHLYLLAFCRISDTAAASVWGDPGRSQRQLLQLGAAEEEEEQEAEDGDAEEAGAGTQPTFLKTCSSVTIESGSGCAGELRDQQQGLSAGSNSVLVAATAYLLPLPAAGNGRQGGVNNKC